MSSLPVRAEASDPALAGGRRVAFARRLLLSQPQTAAGVGILAVFVIGALAAPYIARYPPAVQLGRVYAPPSAAHWLGLDNGGFDVASQLLYGARDSLLVGFVAAVVAMVIGGGVGILSGYVGGATDVVLMRITDYFLVIPDIPLMIVAAALFGQSQRNIIIGLRRRARAARLPVPPALPDRRAGLCQPRPPTQPGRPWRPLGRLHPARRDIVTACSPSSALPAMWARVTCRGCPLLVVAV